MHQSQVNVAACPIFSGNLSILLPAWLERQNHSKIILLTDDIVRLHCLPVFEQKTGLVGLPLIEIPAGEKHKNLSTCEKIWNRFLSEKLDRNALVLNLGGGVVGDMGGFCAATWKRGIDFVQIPTTLLAMTDAAIGGKLGIDFQGIKNTIGVFQNPAAVFCDPDFLATLPDRELHSGFAEVIKHARIGDPVLWRQLLSMTDLRAANWPRLLKKSIAIKIRVVRRDPQEKGLRQILNFGHTIGHALESFFLDTAEPLTHGEAVAIGMVCEQRLSKVAEPSDLFKIVQRFFTHRDIPESIFPALWQLMLQDKKNKAGKVCLAVPTDGKLGMKILEPSQQDVFEILRHWNKQGI